MWVFCRPEWTKVETPWKWILTIFKYKNEYRKQLELDEKNMVICLVFFSYFLSYSHFCILKLSKFILKGVKLGFCPNRFRKHTPWGKYKTRFYFFSRVESKFQNFQGNIMIYNVSSPSSRYWNIRRDVHGRRDI